MDAHEVEDEAMVRMRARLRLRTRMRMLMGVRMRRRMHSWFARSVRRAAIIAQKQTQADNRLTHLANGYDELVELAGYLEARRACGAKSGMLVQGILP